VDGWGVVSICVVFWFWWCYLCSELVLTCVIYYIILYIY
jgi:hypothetical protein